MVTDVSEVAQRVAVCPVWYYFGRNFSFPKWDRIAMEAPRFDQEHVANAVSVFSVMGLDLARLSRIFAGSVEYQRPLEDRAKCELVPEYAELSCCSAGDDPAWTELAKLTQKEIHFVHCHGQPTGRITAIYYPDGRVEHPEYPPSNSEDDPDLML